MEIKNTGLLDTHSSCTILQNKNFLPLTTPHAVIMDSNLQHLNLIPKISTKELRYDILFPDLIFIPCRLECLVYKDYVGKKLLRMGLDEEDINDLFGRRQITPEQLMPSPIDKSNIIFHKGRQLNMAQIEESEKIKVLNEFSFDQLQKYNNLECVRSLYHLSTPTRKLSYPEPFIASPSFIHTDIGFIHILHYQFWLWFFFIFLIIFFFIVFLCTVRWCNMRVRPRRETRGVSRSKCGDLITACVPVSWAISIIVTESTDASDLYDGFGAAELTLGIRAYQWGWEYYYPKDLDLNYNIKSSYNLFLGKSLKYQTVSEQLATRANIWRFYQQSTNESTVNPAQLLLLPFDQKKVVNFMNFGDVGQNTLKESVAFKKIHKMSKTYNSNLFLTGVTRLNSLNYLYDQTTTDASFFKSQSFNFSREHNLLISKSSSSQQNLFLDKSSFDKFLSFNNLNSNKKTSSIPFSTSLLTEKKSYSLKNTTLNEVFKRLNFSNFLNQKDFFLSYKDLLLNNSKEGLSSRKKLNISFFQTKPFSPSIQKLKNTEDTLGLNLSSVFFSNQDLNLGTPTSFVKNSSDKGFSSTNHSPKYYEHLSPFQNSLNFKQDFSHYNKQESPHSSTYDLYNFNKGQGVENLNFYFSSLNKLFFEAPYSPIASSDSSLGSATFDDSSIKYQNLSLVNNSYVLKTDATQSDNIHMFTGKKDGLPKFLSTAYWKLFWAHSTPTLRFSTLLEDAEKKSLSSFPKFSTFYDYDFRNLQAYELLEDLFWELNDSSYNHLDYLTIKNNASSKGVVDGKLVLREPFFKSENNQFVQKNTTSSKQAKVINLPHYSTVTSFDDFSTLPLNLNTNNVSLTLLSNNLLNMEDSYEAWSSLRLGLKKEMTMIHVKSPKHLQYTSTTTVLNNFRADFDDFNFQIDNLKAGDPWSMDLLPNSRNLNDLELKNNRLSSFFYLRSTARNSIVTFNALQKVFRARFEEGRSHSSIANLSTLAQDQLFLTSPKIKYESLLGKTKNFFLTTTTYPTDLQYLTNNFFFLSTSLNYNFFTFPFLLSQRSDMSRYFWFDWYAKWGFVETQASSVSRYSTLGVPYSKKPFEFNTDTSDQICEAETYFTRISRSRKNYLPNWTYTPYMYARFVKWNKNSIFNLYSRLNEDDYTGLRFLLLKGKSFSSTLSFSTATSSNFTPTNSGLNTYTKSSWRPTTAIQSYYYLSSTLSDYLTKREYLLRQYLELNNSLIHLPDDLIAKPNNPLLFEILRSYNLNDPLSWKSESERSTYYNSLEFLKYLLTVKVFNYLKNSSIDLNLVNNYFFFYIFGIKNLSKNDTALELQKNPYRPLRKGVSSMLRLHSTGAIAMPIEIRLQILASSRDVIHSWSIPSAGIKIDCIPGYTSHKVMIFLMEGIYWGQCMEICGRYHHWMPIIVYMMRRDLFFLWCTHFVFNNNLTQMWEINDRRYLDYIKYISYDKKNWLDETLN